MALLITDYRSLIPFVCVCHLYSTTTDPRTACHEYTRKYGSSPSSPHRLNWIRPKIQWTLKRLNDQRWHTPFCISNIIGCCCVQHFFNQSYICWTNVCIGVLGASASLLQSISLGDSVYRRGLSEWEVHCVNRNMVHD